MLPLCDLHSNSTILHHAFHINETSFSFLIFEDKKKESLKINSSNLPTLSQEYILHATIETSNEYYMSNNWHKTELNNIKKKRQTEDFS